MGFKELLRLPRFLRRRHEDAAFALYSAAVVQARHPSFYESLAVPDSLDGRFDMIALHVFLMLRRLRAAGAPARGLSQAIFDVMFADMDQSLRELGVGDVGVGKRVRRMAEAFYGRVAAYDTGLDDAAGGQLEAALLRNVWRGEEVAPAALGALADYVRRQDAALAARPLAELMAGRIDFVPPVGS